MTLEGVVFLTGFTARGKAYAQALNHAGLVPGFTLLYGDPGSDRPGQGGDEISIASSAAEVFLPDLSSNLTTTLDRAGWERSVVTGDSVNAPALTERLRDLSPKLVIFCGYGAEMVGREALNIAPFLHIHSGWLPDYRGSTTGYYSWLETGELAASALILDAQIDTGTILMRKRYLIPPPGVDMDYHWDSAIRADLLVRVMKYFSQCGALPAGVEQSHGEGRTFYVIHPVLKHLAILGKKSPTMIDHKGK